MVELKNYKETEIYKQSIKKYRKSVLKVATIYFVSGLLLCFLVGVFSSYVSILTGLLYGLFLGSFLAAFELVFFLGRIRICSICVVDRKIKHGFGDTPDVHLVKSSSRAWYRAESSAYVKIGSNGNYIVLVKGKNIVDICN